MATYRCLNKGKCNAYQYKGTGPGNCLLIQKNCIDKEKGMFIQESSSDIYEQGFYFQANFLIKTDD